MRERIEVRFERFGRGVVRNPWIAIASCLLLAGSLISQLPPQIETAIETFLEEDDPARIVFDEFRDLFGRAELLMISIEPPDVFDLAFLAKLQAFHEALEQEVPYLDEVSSLINARSTRGEADELIVEDLLEELPSQEELPAFRARVLANPFYRNTLISEDGKFTTLLITLQLFDSEIRPDDEVLEGFGDDTPTDPSTAAPAADAPAFLTGAQIGRSVEAMRDVMERFDSPDFSLAMAGSPVLQQQLVNNLQHDLARFVATMIATVGLLLFVLFRRASGVLLPIGVVILCLLSTLGAMAATGTVIAPPTQVLPTFLLAVGISTAVHVLKIFYRNYDAGLSVEDSVAGFFAHSGAAIVMTGATTAGGLLSFQAAGLQPLIDLGTFVPLGVSLCVMFCLVLLPALLSVLPLKRRQSESSLTAGLEKTIVRLGDFSARNPWKMVAGVGVLVAVSMTGVVQLRFTNDIMAWLPPTDPLRAATDLIDRELRGSITLEVILDTGRDDGVKDPEFLAGLDLLSRRMSKLSRGETLFVGRTISIADVVKEIHKALNENRDAFFTIPDDPRLVSQELLLFENTGTDDLEDIVDTRFRVARFTLKVPYVDPLLYDGFIDEVEAEFRSVLGPSVSIATTGFMGMMSQTMGHVIRGLSRSYMLALMIITPLMVIMLGSLRTGLTSMIPNLSPIIFTLGVMGWLGVTIDMFTMMIGGIAIGLVVDDTIHFMHGFRRYFAQSGDARDAVRQTLETTGQALLFTSVTLSMGFLVFIFSQMQNLFYFGIFTCLAIASAFALDILVSPALMVLATRPKRAR